MLAREQPAVRALRSHIWTARTAQALRGLAGESLIDPASFKDSFIHNELRRLAAALENLEEITTNTHELIVSGSWPVELTHPMPLGLLDYNGTKAAYTSFVMHLDHYISNHFEDRNITSVQVFSRMKTNGLVFNSMCYKYFSHLPLVSAVFEERRKAETYYGCVELFASVVLQDAHGEDMKITVASVWLVDRQSYCLFVTKLLLLCCWSNLFVAILQVVQIPRKP